jgi:hypothetical protein
MRMREASEWPFADPPNVACFTTWRVLDGIEPIVYVSHDADDGAWQFLPESGAIEELAAVVGLARMCQHDPSLLQLARLPLGWRAERSEVDAPWMWLPHDMPLEVLGGVSAEFGDAGGDRDRLTEQANCVIREATHAFVMRDFVRMDRLSRAKVDRGLYCWVDLYPTAIAMPGGDFTKSVDAIRTVVEVQPIWSIYVSLGEVGGGWSDLTLSGELYRFGTEYVFVYTDCHVL